MNEPLYVQLVRMENGELWFFKATEQGWQPHRKITTMIEGEIIQNETGVEVVS